MTPLNVKAGGFVDAVIGLLSDGSKQTKTSLEKLAASFGITSKTEVKELTEFAITTKARKIAHGKGSVEDKYDQIVALYENQVNLSHRTSQSMLLQQYSTPAPIGYLAGVFTGADLLSGENYGFEPSAGNGLLTIAANPKQFVVNEIDDVRHRNLRATGYKTVNMQDASESFRGLEKKFQVVITNPPFGKLSKPMQFGSFKIEALEHAMAIIALQTMKDSGKAAIIIGGHTAWDEKGRVQAGKNRIFLNYLYHHYEVAGILNLYGKTLFSRQGTSVNIRLILIDGRKSKPSGAAPLFDKTEDAVVKTFDELFDRVMAKTNPSLSFLEKQALELQQLFEEGLGAPYIPSSNVCTVLDTQVPDSMAFETHEALKLIKKEVGGDIDNFVRHRLGYHTKADLCKALSAEQTDAVAMAIYNIEARNQGMIIGDQTGIGKGRVAAAVIRYAVQQGLQPVFLTEKSNLFSDIYRDLLAIGSGHLKPFIVNGRESKTDIKDEDGNIVYQAPSTQEQQHIFSSGKLPPSYNYVVATYSQFNSSEKKPTKPAFLQQVAEDNIFILDEAHNSSGSSNTGEFLQGVVGATKGVVFLSATFAKRPDNIPIYAMKTSIADCTMSKDELISAITNGGVALQEIISAQLVSEGQMLRRERSFEGIEVNYITLDEKAEEHKAIADNITTILRDIIAFQANYIEPVISEMDDIAVMEGKEIVGRDGTSKAGVDNQPYFSKIFQVINQMLFSLKAEEVALRAIQRLKEGKKPVIAFSSTMGSFIESIENDHGLPSGDGDVIDADFAVVLKRGLDGVMRYTEKDIDGNPIYHTFEVSGLSPEGQEEYHRISQSIKTITTGITISPIDVVVKKIKEAGFSVAEVTGRKFELQLNWKGNKALVKSRKKINTNDAFRQFNNNEVDVLMINQSGSTGASAHAIATKSVGKNEVRQRVMIVLQAELDINTEVQKRGRINRTGQILKPIYDYVSSAIPAEKRLMMMLQKKLKSLDANTASNQKQSSSILSVPDFLNKYGDKVVKEYLQENQEVNNLLDNPLGLGNSEQGEAVQEGAAHKVSGRVAVLSTEMQQDFYNEVTERYNDFTEYLRQIGEYDLEVEAMNLQTEPIREKVVKMGQSSGSVFGQDSILLTVMANVLKKPFTGSELDNLLNESLGGKDPLVLQTELLEEYSADVARRDTEEIEWINEHYAELLEEVPKEKRIKKLSGDEKDEEIKKRTAELKSGNEMAIRMYRTKSDNKKNFISRIFKFFYPGRLLNFQQTSYAGGRSTVGAVFIGYQIDRKKKNPFTASNIKLRFALANSTKYMATPASISDYINGFMGASYGLRQPSSRKELLDSWDNLTKESTGDRKIRHIVTGNVLQAFTTFKGKLVSYTTMKGEIEKGILMPEYWSPEEQIEDKVVVPIIKALPIIASIQVGNSLKTNSALSFHRYPGYFKVVVPSSKTKGGDLFLDKDLLEHLDRNIFEKVSDKMVGRLEDSNLDKFVATLQRKHSTSVTIRTSQLKSLENGVTVVYRKPIALPPPEEEYSADVFLLELEAEALALELELLNAA